MRYFNAEGKDQYWPNKITKTMYRTNIVFRIGIVTGEVYVINKCIFLYTFWNNAQPLRTDDFCYLYATNDRGDWRWTTEWYTVLVPYVLQNEYVLLLSFNG